MPVDATFDFTAANGTTAPSGWATTAGTMGVLSNRLTVRSGSWTDGAAVCSTPTPTTENQWLCTQLWNAGSNRFAQLYFLAAVDLTTALSLLYNAESPGALSVYANATQRGSTQNLGALANGDKLGVTIEHISGTTYSIRVWRNPTANEPVSVTEWDSGDTTPSIEWLNLNLVSFTADAYMGLGGVAASADVIQFDNTSIGHFAAGGAASLLQPRPPFAHMLVR